MAWPTLVQGTGDKVTTGSSSLSKTFASSTTNGNILIIGATWWRSGVVPTMVISDNKSNTFTQLAMACYTDVCCGIWLANNIAGGSSHQITATPSATSTIGLSIGEWSGASSVQATGMTHGTGSGTSATTANNTIATTSDLLFGVGFSFTFATTISVGSGFTTQFTSTGAATPVVGILTEYQTGLSSPTALAWTLGSSGGWGTCAVVLSPTVAGGSVIVIDD